MKKIKHIILAIGLVFMSFNYSCNNNDDTNFHFEAIATTPTGIKLVEGTNLVAQVIKDSTYTITNGAIATEIQYVSSLGYAMKLFIFEVDLTNPDVTIEVSTANNEPTFKRQRMTEQAIYKDTEGRKVWGGVNGDFFDGNTAIPQGILYKNGTAIKTTFADPVCTYFAITHDNKALIGRQSEYDDLKSSFKEALGGRVQLMLNGNKVIQTDKAVEPRTSVGVSEDGTKVFLLAVDGRNFWHSNGMTYDDLSQCMEVLGAYNAINLDGGGSTSFLIRNTPDFSDNRFELRNWPTDYGGAEREVTNGLLIISKK